MYGWLASLIPGLQKYQTCLKKKEKKNVEFLQFLLFYFKVDFHQVLLSFV